MQAARYSFFALALLAKLHHARTAPVAGAGATAKRPLFAALGSTLGGMDADSCNEDINTKGGAASEDDELVIKLVKVVRQYYKCLAENVCGDFDLNYKQLSPSRTQHDSTGIDRPCPDGYSNIPTELADAETACVGLDASDDVCGCVNASNAWKPQCDKCCKLKHRTRPPSPATGTPYCDECPTGSEDQCDCGVCGSGVGEFIIRSCTWSCEYEGVRSASWLPNEWEGTACVPGSRNSPYHLDPRKLQCAPIVPFRTQNYLKLIDFFDSSIVEYVSLAEMKNVKLDEMRTAVQQVEQDLDGKVSDAIRELQEAEAEEVVAAAVGIAGILASEFFPASLIIDADSAWLAHQSQQDAAMAKTHLNYALGNISNFDKFTMTKFPDFDSLNPIIRYLDANSKNAVFLNKFGVGDINGKSIHRGLVQSMLSDVQLLGMCDVDELKADNGARCLEDAFVYMDQMLNAKTPVGNSVFYKCYSKIVSCTADASCRFSKCDEFGKCVVENTDAVTNRLLGSFFHQGPVLENRHTFYSAAGGALQTLAGSQMWALFKYQHAAGDLVPAVISNRFPRMRMWTIRYRWNTDATGSVVEEPEPVPEPNNLNTGSMIAEDGDAVPRGLPKGPSRGVVVGFRVLQAFTEVLLVIQGVMALYEIFELAALEAKAKSDIAKVSKTVQKTWEQFFHNITQDTLGRNHEPCPEEHTFFERTVKQFYRGGLCYDSMGGLYALDVLEHGGRTECELTGGFRNGNTYDPNGAAHYCGCTNGESGACDHCCKYDFTPGGFVRGPPRLAKAQPWLDLGTFPGGKNPVSCHPGCKVFGPDSGLLGEVDECECNVCGSSFKDRTVWVPIIDLFGVTRHEEVIIPGCKKNDDGSWAKGTSCDADLLTRESGFCNSWLEPFAAALVGCGFFTSGVNQPRVRFSSCQSQPSAGDDVCDPRWTKAQRVPDCSTPGYGPEDGGGAKCVAGTATTKVDGKFLCVEQSDCVPEGGDTCDAQTYGLSPRCSHAMLPPIGGATCCKGLAPVLSGGKYLCLSAGASRSMLTAD